MSLERLRVLSSFITQKWQRFLSLFFSLQIQCSSYYNSAYISQIRLPQKCQTFSSPYPHSILDTLPHSEPWEEQHCIPYDHAPPVSVTDPRIDIWPKLGHSDTLPRIWNRDKEAESFRVKLQGHALLACHSRPKSHASKWEEAEKLWISRKSQSANREAEGCSRCPGTNRDTMYHKRQRRDQEKFA